MSPTITVSELWVYPVKSCAGVRLTEATLGPRGIVHDRSWMVVRPDGTFVTQREYPRLAVVAPSLRDGQLWLHAPDAAPVAVPIEGDGEQMDVVVWRDRCRAIDQGDAIAAWLSAVLAAPCRLVRMADDWVRTVDQAYAQPQDQVGFADGFPLLLASESSLDDLNSRMEHALPMNRFRPNIVIRGTAPFAEDRWDTITIGDLTMRVVKPCARCVTTTVDQVRGVSGGAEPLRTLATFRKQNGKVMFAQNVIHDREGVLRVGDEVEVLTTDDRPPTAGDEG
jgi:uncharacterized protein